MDFHERLFSQLSMFVDGHRMRASDLFAPGVGRGGDGVDLLEQVGAGVLDAFKVSDSVPGVGAVTATAALALRHTLENRAVDRSQQVAEAIPLRQEDRETWVGIITMNLVGRYMVALRHLNTVAPQQRARNMRQLADYALSTMRQAWRWWLESRASPHFPQQTLPSLDWLLAFAPLYVDGGGGHALSTGQTARDFFRDVDIAVATPSRRAYLWLQKLEEQNANSRLYRPGYPSEEDRDRFEERPDVSLSLLSQSLRFLTYDEEEEEMGGGVMGVLVPAPPAVQAITPQEQSAERAINFLRAKNAENLIQRAGQSTCHECRRCRVYCCCGCCKETCVML